MKKYVKRIIIGTTLLIALSFMGYLVYQQLIVHQAYPDDPIGVRIDIFSFQNPSSPIGFSTLQSGKLRVDFATTTLRYQAEIWTDTGLVVKDENYTWRVKQGAYVIDEMPLDGIERQSSKGRIGPQTLSVSECKSAAGIDLTKKGYSMVGDVIYAQPQWPEWPEETYGFDTIQDWIDWPAPKKEGPSRTDIALEKMGIYRREDPK